MLKASHARPQPLIPAPEPDHTGAEVVARYKAPSAAGNIGAAGETAASGITATDGTFTVGPLYDDAQYEVVLSKPGTEFAAKSGGPDYVFSAKKLAQVHRVIRALY